MRIASGSHTGKHREQLGPVFCRLACQKTANLTCMKEVPHPSVIGIIGMKSDYFEITCLVPTSNAICFTENPHMVLKQSKYIKNGLPQTSPTRFIHQQSRVNPVCAMLHFKSQQIRCASPRVPRTLTFRSTRGNFLQSCLDTKCRKVNSKWMQLLRRKRLRS